MMKIDARRAREISDLVNSRVPILDLLKSSGLKLILSGATWKALCPFHDDKDTASFTVKPEFNYVHCFGCDQTWFPVKFVMDYEKKTWTEAITELATKYSINLSAFEKALTGNEVLLEDARAVNASAADWLYKQTEKFPKAKQYLLSRYDEETIKKWKLGYCCNGDKLLEFLLKKCRYDYNLIKKVDIHPYMFNDRIVYPVFDMFGNVVGFSCRVWALTKADEEKKYKSIKEKGDFRKFINTSGKSILFKYKSSNLYGLNFARKSIRKSKGTILIVEGCSDVILMHKHGFENCAGVLSASFNKHSLSTLVDISVQNIVFCLDGDGTGQKRTLDLLLAQKKLMAEIPDDALKIQYKAISIPNGEDPDEFLAKASNASLMKKMADNALNLPEFYIHHKKQAKPVLETITDKIDFIFEIRKDLAPLLTRAEISVITNHLRDTLGIPPIEFNEYLNIRGNNKVQAKKIEEKILAWLVQDKDFREAHIETEFNPKMFSNGYSTLFRIIKELHLGKTKLVAVDELDDKKINIDSIIERAKQLRILSFFVSEQDVRNALNTKLPSKKGLLTEFRDWVKQQQIRDFISKLSSLANQNTYKEIVDFIKDNLNDLE